jgi:hypothetical protein
MDSSSPESRFRREYPHYEARLRERFIEKGIPVNRKRTEEDELEPFEEYRRRKHQRFVDQWNDAVGLYKERGIEGVTKRIDHHDRRLEDLESSQDAKRWNEKFHQKREALMVILEAINAGEEDEKMGERARKPPFGEFLHGDVTWRKAREEVQSDLSSLREKLITHEEKVDRIRFHRNVLALVRTMDEEGLFVRKIDDGTAVKEDEVEDDEGVTDINDRLPEPPKTDKQIRSTLLAWFITLDLEVVTEPEINKGIGRYTGEGEKDYLKTLKERVIPRFGYDGIDTLEDSLRFAVYTYAEKGVGRREEED